MMNKVKSLVVFAAILLASTFTSCEKDDDTAKPVVSALELGIGNSLTAFIGSDLHMNAEIVADGKIDVVKVEIHKEDGSAEEIEAEYNDFSGQRNATFHKHIDIPATATAGDYHFHLTVVDMEGNSTEVEAEIKLEVLVDTEKPVFNFTSTPTNGQSFAKGETISISGTVTDNSALSGMLVALVYEPNVIEDADVTGGNSKVIVMTHTHDFDSKASHTFTSSIEVGATNDNNMEPAAIEGDNAWKSGNYYILARCKDAMGNWVFSSRYPVKINL